MCVGKPIAIGAEVERGFSRRVVEALPMTLALGQNEC
jgi:hypothetical protein